MRLSGTKATAIHQYRGLGNQLWDLAGNRPSLDLRFADDKSLVDATTGTTLVDHNRASLGTYVGSDGLIKTATTNLLPRSEEFDQSPWNLTTAGGTVTITPNATLAPDGKYTAERFESNGGSNGLVQVLTLDLLQYTYSIYVKQAGADSDAFVRLSIGPFFFSFNLVTGDFFDIDASFSPPVATQVGNGWWRISGSRTATATANAIRVVGVIGEGPSDIYIWGAQLEQSSTVGEYIPTTSTKNSAPRFDHDPTTGESLGLLVEEDRTNLIRSSVYTANTNGWTNGVLGGTGTIVSASVTNKAGNTNGVFNLSGLNGISYVGAFASTISSTNVYTASIFIKNNGGTVFQMRLTSQTGGTFKSSGTQYTFATGTWEDGLAGTTVPISRSVQDMGDGWFRFSITAADNGTGNTQTALLLFGSAATTNYNYYFWGAQLEEGSFPTSYIPSNGSQGDRAADVVSISGNNFGTTNLLLYSEEFDDASWDKINCSITPNNALAPDGTFTADKFENTVTGLTRCNQSITVTSGTDYTASIYLKAGTLSSDIRWREDSEDALDIVVDLSAGIITSGTGTIDPVGNGWYRVSFTGSVSGTVFKPEIRTLNDGSVYIWGAQLEQSDVVTPYVKSNVTWNSRASNATYYDATGTLRKSSYNLLTYSEEFDDASWTPTGLLAFGSGSTANAIAAPDGTMTADLLTENLGTGFHEIRQSSSYQSGVTYTWSVFFKAASGTRNFQAVLSTAAFPGNPFVLVNPTTGEIISSSDINASVQSYPDGWYRASFSATADASAADQFYLRLVDGTSNNYTGDGTSGIYVWGAQLERGTYAGDYAKTEATAASTARNAAYLPDDSGNFISAGPLLLEDDATNLLPVSEDVAYPSYQQYEITPSVNTAVAPDGSTTADTIAPTAVLTEHFIGYTAPSNVTAGTTYTFSAFVKPNGTDSVRIRFAFAGFNNENGSHNFTTGITSAGNCNFQIQPYANGWYRIQGTAVASSTGSAQPRIYPKEFNSWLGVPSEALFVWGAQLEAGSYPTSYIPTYGITADRSADVSTSTSGFGNSWYRQDAGTARVEWHNTAQKSWDTYDAFFAVRNVGTTEYFGYGITNGRNNYQVYWSAKTSNNNQLIYGSYSPGFPYVPEGSWTHAIASTTNDAAFYQGGSQRRTDDSITMPSPTEAVFNTTNTCLKRVTFWPQRLPNSTLSTITQ